MRVFKPTELLKAKYSRRWKGKDGKWNYEYSKPKKSKKGKKKKATSKKAPQKKKVSIPSVSGSRGFMGETTKPLKKLLVAPELHKQSWTQNVEPGRMIMGERWGKAGALYAESKLAKFMSDPTTKAFIQGTLNERDESWSSWASLTDKHVALVTRAVKDINKGVPANDILEYVEYRHPVFKSSLLRVLEIGAYMDDPERAVTSQSRMYRGYGLSEKESKVRAKTYLLSLKTRAGEWNTAKKVWGKK